MGKLHFRMLRMIMRNNPTEREKKTRPKQTQRENKPKTVRNRDSTTTKVKKAKERKTTFIFDEHENVDKNTQDNLRIAIYEIKEYKVVRAREL